MGRAAGGVGGGPREDNCVLREAHGGGVAVGTWRVDFELGRRHQTLLVMEAGRTQLDHWRDLWRHRKLIYHLARRILLYAS